MQDVDQALARAFARQQARTTTNEVPAVPPAPHFVVEPPTIVQTEIDSSREVHGTTVLDWPQTVRSLEREHGARFQSLADALLEIRDTKGIKVILFTSCHRAEGRTTLVLTLARALARRSGRTLLIDADLTGPMLARQLGIRPRVGLDDVVEDGRALADAIIEVPDDHLSLLPLRAAVHGPREFLASAAWSCSMAKLRREYDLILIDGSPLFAGLSAAVMHRSVDAAILVHHRALTGERALLRAQEVLEAGGIPLLGLAETFV